jgi:hypothetical protein
MDPIIQTAFDVIDPMGKPMHIDLAMSAPKKKNDDWIVETAGNHKANCRQLMKALILRASGGGALLGVLAFWGGMFVAKRHFPEEFDWRYMTLTTLLSVKRNPAGCWWANGGIVLSALCVLCWTLALAKCWAEENSGIRPRGTWLLTWGSVCMAFSVLLPGRFPKEHEILSLLAFFGLCLGMIRLAFHLAERAFRLHAGDPVRRSRLYSATLAGIVGLPILLASLAQAYVFYVLPELHWVSLAWRAQGVPVCLSFAFWEWITCIVISAYLAVLSLAAWANLAGYSRLEAATDSMQS